MKYLALLFWLIAPCVYADTVIKIAVVDTGLDLSDPRFAGKLCPTGHEDFTGEGISDKHGHGTHVAGLIKRGSEGSNFCLIILKYYQESADGKTNLARTVKAFRKAAALGVDFVNYSGGGPEFVEDEYLAIRDADHTTFVVAAGNEKSNIDEPGKGYFPASYPAPNIVVVGALGANGLRLASSNYGNKVTRWEIGEGVISTLPGGKEGPMTGTSMATAIATADLVSRRAQQGKPSPSRLRRLYGNQVHQE